MNKIFTVNPGSTSTKIALFEDSNCVYSANVIHSDQELKQFSTISEQLIYRSRMILRNLRENAVSLEGLTAVVGRGGGLLSVEGGTYDINDTLLRHAVAGANGVQHPAQLGPQIAAEVAAEYGVRAFVVNPPDVDELQDVARLTGVKGVYRTVHLHALNLKETAIRHSRRMGKRYEEANYVVCHLGGGVSVSAHRAGRMVDGYDIVGGEGPMAPTRCGALSVAALLAYGKTHSPEELTALCQKSGGFISHVGTSDARKLRQLAQDGDRYAGLVWDAMVYQIAKAIGSMAAVLRGRVDGILLSGGMAYDIDLVAQLRDYCEFIAPVFVYAGEFEMEAMAEGALRVLRGEEEAKQYSGKPSWSGFEFEEE